MLFSCFSYSSMKLIDKTVTSAKVIIACFIHLHIVKIEETRKVTKITKNKKDVFLIE